MFLELLLLIHILTFSFTYIINKADSLLIFFLSFLCYSVKAFSSPLLSSILDLALVLVSTLLARREGRGKEEGRKREEGRESTW